MKGGHIPGETLCPISLCVLVCDTRLVVQTWSCLVSALERASLFFYNSVFTNASTEAPVAAETPIRALCSGLGQLSKCDLGERVVENFELKQPCCSPEQFFPELCIFSQFPSTLQHIPEVPWINNMYLSC